MAWPCISRVCCLARLWGQLDKSDLAVPLTLRSYSDIDEPPPPAGPAAPSPPETQYRRDFRAWPLPRRPPAAAATSSPWPGGREGGAVYVLPAAEPARPRAARPPRSPCPPAAAATSSYRYRGGGHEQPQPSPPVERGREASGPGWRGPSEPSRNRGRGLHRGCWPGPARPGALPGTGCSELLQTSLPLFNAL